MARSYTRPPGITVTEVTQTSVNPLIATPDLLCLVGPSSGSIEVEELVGPLSGTTGSKLISITDTDQLTSSSIISVSDPESSIAQASNSAYTSNSGYIPGSYTLNTTAHTIARKTSVTTADLKTDPTASGLSISAVGDAGAFASYNTIAIESEQITYTGITLTANEKQTIAIGVGVNGGTFTVTFGGVVTAALAYNVSTAALKTALEGLSSIGTGNVDVTGTAGTSYVIEFKGDFAGENVALLTLGVGSLTGGTATVSTTTDSEFTFTGCTRGANQTTAAAHTAASGVIKLGYVIPNNTAVWVKYKYTPADYYKPYEVTASNFSEVERRFGKAFKDDGVTVNSPLTLAAQIAIENGADQFLIQPLFYTTQAIDTEMATRNAPTNAQSIDPTNWEKTFASLRNYENIGTIVPVVGQTSSYTFGSDATTNNVINDAVQLTIIKKLQAHIAYVSQQNAQSTIGIFGYDSTDSTTPYATRSQLITDIATLQGYTSNGKSYNEQLVFIAQTSFERPSTKSSSQYAKLGGQYAAAAIAGMLVSRNVSAPLTRKAVAGFYSINDTRTKSQKTADSGLGFLVIEQKRDRTIQVRHSLTIDNTTAAKAELSVVRAKFFMIDSLVQTIDTQVIGQMVADDTAPVVIKQVVAGTLRTLQENMDIVGFDSVQVKSTSTDPTILEVRFNYRPAFPINYIDIKFTVDLTSGATSLNTTDQANLGA